jgi:hypothetical protein
MAEENASVQAPWPNEALRRLEPLVGDWEIVASIGGKPLGRGRSTFAWLEGGAFLVQHSEVEQAGVPIATTIIGPDDSTETWCMLYSDSRGVSRVYQMSLSDGVWKLWREAPGFSQRFTGTLRSDGKVITGRWEKSFDGSTWEHDFDLTYTQASS